MGVDNTTNSTSASWDHPLEHSSHGCHHNQNSTEFVLHDSDTAPPIVNARPAISDSCSNTSLPGSEKQGEYCKTWKAGRAEWSIMITMAVTSLIVALDTTVLVPALPTLATDLHGSSQEAFWVGTSYLLANAVFQPFLAAVSETFGRREVLLPSIFAFSVGSIICGCARSFTDLLAGRVIQGIGGAGIMTLAQIVFADIIPLRQRPKYFSIVLGAWGVGTVLGPLIGGVLVETSTWRWCFWLNLPICGLASIMVFFFVKLTMPKMPLAEKLLQVDCIGAFLFIASLTSFLIAISWGGVQFAWSSWRTRLPLAMSTIGLIGTLVWERYYAREPFLNKSLFCNGSAILSYLCALCQGATLLMALYYCPFYFSAVHHASPLTSGVDLLPALVCLLPGSAIVSALITRLGHYRIFIWLGWAIGTVGTGISILFDENTPTAVWATSLCITGIGMGMVLSSVNFSVQACVEPKDAGRAASMYAFMRSVGMSLGVAVGGSVFQNHMKRELRSQDLPESFALIAEGFVHSLWDPAVTPQPQFTRLRAAYVHGFRGVFETLTVICGVAFLLSLFIKHFNMDRILESKFTVRR